MTSPLISVCIVTAGRPALLDSCLASLQAQVDPPPFELLVCCDGDNNGPVVVFNRFPGATVGVTEPALPGAARNLLIARAEGELLLFLDDDVVADAHLLRRLADAAAAWPEVTVFGGPNETPPGSSRFQVIQGAVLASLVGSGPVRRRYGRHRAGPADERFFTLCNLAIRRRAMLPFPPDVVCAEENVVLTELSRRGVAMRYDPDLVVFHERRATVRGFLAQVFKYGRGRGQLTARAPTTFRPAFAAPVVLLVYVGLVPVLLAYDRAWLVPLAAYGAIVVAGGARVAWTLRRATAAPTAGALIAGMHTCYAAGIVTGLLSKRSSGPILPRCQWVSVAGPLSGKMGIDRT